MYYTSQNTNSSLSFLPAYDGNIAMPTDSYGEHYPFYFIKDHLGNIRETFINYAPNANWLIQRMQYYPSGLMWDVSSGAIEHPYRNNGKGFIEAHGLNEYDSQARMYYAPIMRTTTMDPLAEKYYHISPYAWCGNNPTNAIDPEGRAVYNFNTFGEYIGKTTQDGAHFGAMYGDNGQLIFTFEFADPINDPEAIDHGKIDQVQIVTDEQISEILTKSGVEDKNNKANKYSYILIESNSSNIDGNGYMDYVATGLYQGATISKYTNYLFVTNTNGKLFAHNTYNFGNFLWGAGASALGIPYPIAKLGAHLHNYFSDPNSKRHLDSKDDQLSIKLGYLWQKRK